MTRKEIRDKKLLLKVYNDKKLELLKQVELLDKMIKNISLNNENIYI